MQALARFSQYLRYLRPQPSSECCAVGRSAADAGPRTLATWSGI
jgi:hypothetical protein